MPTRLGGAILNREDVKSAEIGLNTDPLYLFTDSQFCYVHVLVAGASFCTKCIEGQFSPFGIPTQQTNINHMSAKKSV